MKNQREEALDELANHFMSKYPNPKAFTNDTVFKCRNSDYLNKRFEVFMEKYKDITQQDRKLEKMSRMDNRMFGGVTLAGGAAVYGAIGIIVASPIMPIAGIGVAVGALAYAGISKLCKEHFRPKSNIAIQQNAEEKLIDKFSEQMNINPRTLEDLKNIRLDKEKSRAEQSRLAKNNTPEELEWIKSRVKKLGID